MKKFLFMLVALLTMSTASFAQKGVTGFGVTGAYDDLFGQFGLGIKLQYGFIDQLRGDLGTEFYFKKDGMSLADVNGNLHFVVPVVDKFNVYPLAGLNIAFFNNNVPTRLGVNLGGGLEYFITDQVKIGAEAKYIVSDNGFSRFNVGGGVTFIF